MHVYLFSLGLTTTETSYSLLVTVEGGRVCVWGGGGEGVYQSLGGGGGGVPMSEGVYQSLQFARSKRFPTLMKRDRSPPQQ